MLYLCRTPFSLPWACTPVYCSASASSEEYWNSSPVWPSVRHAAVYACADTSYTLPASSDNRRGNCRSADSRAMVAFVVSIRANQKPSARIPPWGARFLGSPLIPCRFCWPLSLPTIRKRAFLPLQRIFRLYLYIWNVCRLLPLSETHAIVNIAI